MSESLTFLALGFLVVWLALGVYLVRMSRTQKRLSERLAALESRNH